MNCVYEDKLKALARLALQHQLSVWIEESLEEETNHISGHVS